MRVNREQDLGVGTMLLARRRFLLDLAWPMETTDLADMFGLPPSSADVAVEELAASRERLRALINRLPDSALVGPASDMARLIATMNLHEDLQTLTAWLVTYTLAVINMVEALGDEQ